MKGEQKVNDQELTLNKAVNEFYRSITRRIIHLKEAYLLVDLLRYLKYVCVEQGTLCPVNETRGLRRILEARFQDQIGFFHTGRNCVVHNPEVNPCERV